MAEVSENNFPVIITGQVHPDDIITTTISITDTSDETMSITFL